MASTLSQLPNELLYHIARFLPLGDRLRFGGVHRRILPNARRALYNHAEVVTLGCRSHQCWNNPQPCDRFLFAFMVWQHQSGVLPLSLTLRTDYTALEPTQHPLLRLWMASQLPIHQWLDWFKASVVALMPVRTMHPVVGDWINQMYNSDYHTFGAIELILNGANLRELSSDSSSSDLDATNALTFALWDIGANAQTSAGVPDRPLSRLRVLKVGQNAIGGPPSSIVYGGDLSCIPTLEKAYYKYGLPITSGNLPSLHTLHIKAWGCRHPNTAPAHLVGELPMPVAPINGATDPHLDAHRTLFDLIEHAPGLEDLEITDCRGCNWLLTPYSFTDTAPGMNGALTTEATLPAKMRQHLINLKTFKMRSRIAPAGLNSNGGYWLYRWYHNSFGNWGGFHALQHLELDSWFLFEGFPDGAPVNTPHPPVVQPIAGWFLPNSLKTLKVANLVDGYIDQFYNLLIYIWHEKFTNGSFPELTEITFSLLHGTHQFPPQGKAFTIQQIRFQLYLAGVNLVRRNF